MPPLVEFLSSTVSPYIMDVIVLSVLTGECLRGHLLGTMRNVNSWLNSVFKNFATTFECKATERVKRRYKMPICRLQFETSQVVGMALPRYLRRRVCAV